MSTGTSGSPCKTGLPRSGHRSSIADGPFLYDSWRALFFPFGPGCDVSVLNPSTLLVAVAEQIFGFKSKDGEEPGVRYQQAAPYPDHRYPG